MAGSIRCANCGEEISSSSRFCPSCAARICPGCHGVAPINVKFCPQCGFAVGTPPMGTGTPLESLSERQQAQPTSPPPPLPPTPTPTPQHMPSSGLEETPNIPTPRIASEYKVDRQFIKSHGYGLPNEAAEKAERKEQTAEYGAWGAQPAQRRIPNFLVAIVTVIGIALAGFFIYNTDFGQGIVSAAKDSIGGFFSSFRLPSLTPGTSENITQIAISEVNVSGLSQSNATISWTTNKPATSQVMICDPNGLCTWTEQDMKLVTQHSVNVTNLKPGTNYHYTTLSLDDKQNEAKWEGDLVTLGVTPQAPLLVSAITNTNTNQTNTTITWETNEPATSQVEYGTTESYGNVTIVDNKLVTTHKVALTGLSPATTYHYRIRSKDATGTEIVSEGGRTFTTRQEVTISEGTEAGKRAPGFSLPALNGNTVTLSNYLGKIVLLNFWASLPASRNELPIVQQLYDTWSKDRLAVLTINVQESEKDIELFMSSKGLTFPVLLDTQGDVASLYDVGAKPTSFLIDSQGIIREVKPRPFRTIEEIEAALNKLN